MLTVLGAALLHPPLSPVLCVLCLRPGALSHGCPTLGSLGPVCGGAGGWVRGADPEHVRGGERGLGLGMKHVPGFWNNAQTSTAQQASPARLFLEPAPQRMYNPEGLLIIRFMYSFLPFILQTQRTPDSLQCGRVLGAENALVAWQQDRRPSQGASPSRG